MTEQNTPGQWNVPRARVQVLTDVIFASAMMFTLIRADIPEIAVETDDAITTFILERLPAIGVYFTTFVLLSLYWLKQLQNSSYLIKTSVGLLWIQLFYLAAIALIPFSNAYISAFPGNYAGQIHYSCNVIVVGLLGIVGWRFAVRKRLVKPDLPAAEIRRVTVDGAVEPAAALLSIATAWIQPWFWEPTLILVPVCVMAWRWRARKRAAA